MACRVGLGAADAVLGVAHGGDPLERRVADGSSVDEEHLQPSRGAFAGSLAIGGLTAPLWLENPTRIVPGDRVTNLVLYDV